jgi:NADH:ubiquinone oxidoreductase subunit E
MPMESKHTCACGRRDAGDPLSDPGVWARLDEIIAQRRRHPGALIPVLHEAQELIGYLPAEVQERVAAGLGVPVSEVNGVVSFYSYFTMVPRGEHTVRVCLGTACYVRGGRKVLDEVKGKLGVEVAGTTDDREFSLEVVRCVGACGLAPVMTVDKDVFRRVKPSKIGSLLAKYRNGGKA